MEEERIDDELLDLDDVLAPEEASSDTGQLYEHFRVEVDKGQEPERIDKYLSVRMQHSSRNRIQKAADAGSIHVNGTPVKSNYKVRPEDVITLMLHQPKHDTSIVAEDIPLDIVYEDDQLMVINKPAGMVVHPGAGNFHGTLINAVAWHMRNVPSFDANNPEVGLSAHGRLPSRLGDGQASRNPLARTRTLRLHDARGVYPRDRTHTPDPRTHAPHRPSALRRRTLWRHGDPARTA